MGICLWQPQVEEGDLDELQIGEAVPMIFEAVGTKPSPWLYL